MSAIKIARPKHAWSVSPATVLPTALLLRLFRVHWNLTVVLDGKPVGKIGVGQVKVIEVEPGEHSLFIRFALLRRSAPLRLVLAENEHRELVCGTNGIGWPTLEDAPPPRGATSPG